MAESVLICGQCGRSVIAGPAACPHCGATLKGRGARAAAPASTGAVLLLVIGAAAAGVGVILTSQATAGPAIIALACFLGIAARLAQASNHQKNLLALLVRQADRSRADERGA